MSFSITYGSTEPPRRRVELRGRTAVVGGKRSRGWIVSVLAGGVLVACTEPLPPQGDGRSDAGSALYEKVEAIFARSCSLSRCHDGALIGAGLYLPPGGDYRQALVGVQACQYDPWNLVEPGDPEHSWLMVKLTAPFRPLQDPYANYIHFEPEPGWDPNRRGCPDETEDGVPLFGHRMPDLAPNELRSEELEAVRSWIAAGAPGAPRDN